MKDMASTMGLTKLNDHPLSPSLSFFRKAIRPSRFETQVSEPDSAFVLRGEEVFNISRHFRLLRLVLNMHYCNGNY